MYFNKVVTNAADFQAKFKADLLAAGWTIDWSSTSAPVDPNTGETLTADEYAVKSPTGVVASFKAVSENLDHVAYTEFVGAVGITPNAGSFIQHPNASFAYTIPLSGNLGMEYWLSVTSNRINMMWKISNSYFVMSVGRFLPYALPAEYPYPLFVGSVTPGVKDWRSASVRTFINSNSDDCSAFLDVSGIWQKMRQYSTSSGYIGYTLWYTGRQTFPNADSNGGSTYLSDEEFHAVLSPCLGGGHHTMRVPINHRGANDDYTTGTTFGVLDGFRKALGINQVPENNLTFNTLDMITCQNVTEITTQDYWALEKV